MTHSCPTGVHRCVQQREHATHKWAILEAGTPDPLLILASPSGQQCHEISNASSTSIFTDRNHGRRLHRYQRVNAAILFHRNCPATLQWRRRTCCCMEYHSDGALPTQRMILLLVVTYGLLARWRVVIPICHSCTVSSSWSK